MDACLCCQFVICSGSESPSVGVAVLFPVLLLRAHGQTPTCSFCSGCRRCEIGFQKCVTVGLVSCRLAGLTPSRCEWLSQPNFQMNDTRTMCAAVVCVHVNTQLRVRAQPGAPAPLLPGRHHGQQPAAHAGAPQRYGLYRNRRGGRYGTAAYCRTAEGAHAAVPGGTAVTGV